MILERILPYSKTLLRQVVKKGDVVIDATAGNGYDTIYLAQLVGENGHVYSFDVQESAIRNTQARLDELNIKQATLIHDGHQHVKHYLPKSCDGLISAAIFNLGYLPGSDHLVTTEGETTLQAIHDILDLLQVNGVIILVIYHGHAKGKLEKNFLLEHLSTFEQKSVSVLEYRFLNQKGDAPFIIAIEKQKTYSR
ncbi:MAG: class I SAM-dependent methyltransferase [Turicibacter sp.]